jgi:hypothetical protein
MILSMATAIAQSQKELDKASIVTLKELAGTSFKFIENITEVLEPIPQTIETNDGRTVTVTGVNVTTTIGPSVPMTLLQAGLTPTFYQFTESVISIKIALSMSSEASFGINVSRDFSLDYEVATDDGSGNTSSGKMTYAAHVDASYSSKYSYSADGSSSLSTTLRPVPPPPRVMPRFISVNAFFNPPQVNVST